MQHLGATRPRKENMCVFLESSNNCLTSITFGGYVKDKAFKCGKRKNKESLYVFGKEGCDQSIHVLYFTQRICSHSFFTLYEVYIKKIVIRFFTHVLKVY